jgi:hypothetical protein
MLKTNNKKNRKSKTTSKKNCAASSSGVLEIHDSLVVEQLVTSYIAPFTMSPDRPISLSLERQELYQHMYVINNFLLPMECAMWVDYAEGKGFVDVFHAATSEYAHRDNGRIQYDDAALAESLFHRLALLMPSCIDGLKPYGCSSNIRIYRYRKGQRFGRHIDESNASKEGVSKFTLLLYLNGQEEINHVGEGKRQRSESKSETGTETPPLVVAQQEESPLQLQTHLQGGETLFYSSMYGRQPVVSVRPVAGRVLLHGHGHRCLTHEGAEVVLGAKYVLRTDVIYR